MAAGHPVAWFNAIELRALEEDGDVPNFIDPAKLQQMLLVCIDGRAEAPEVEQQLGRECEAWREQIGRSGVRLAGAPLAAPADARVVRVRDGETMVSEGSMFAGEEFLGGFDLLSCETFGEAVGWAAKHPIARFHQIEVRSFIDLGQRDQQ